MANGDQMQYKPVKKIFFLRFSVLNMQDSEWDILQWHMLNPIILISTEYYIWGYFVFAIG